MFFLADLHFESEYMLSGGFSAMASPLHQAMAPQVHKKKEGDYMLQGMCYQNKEEIAET